jgi:NAD(P)-dependent dehydrogenase (short-subunit alcohol dehydrogenase family)
MTNKNDINKTAIITGASGSGIGRSVALALARENYNIVINYRKNRLTAEKLAAYITENGGSAIAVQADVFVKNECNKLVEKCIEKFGRVDICIINPGANWNCEELHELDSNKSIVDVQQELLPIYNLLPLVVSDMQKRNWGRIIAISSNMNCPSPSYSYNTAKCCRRDAVLNAAEELWKYRITANVISPGPIEHFQSFEDAINAIDSKMHTNITPQNIADIVAFLCSDKADFVTGSNLNCYF